MKRDKKIQSLQQTSQQNNHLLVEQTQKNLMGAKNILKPHAHNEKKTLLWMRKKVSRLHYNVRQVSIFDHSIRDGLF
ncbi:hypothetical protein [Lysinibacillus capsici]|uniref:hypothetical protein n=1 Tax=Lysinibacillus capsici TaxID=2115968 RepID=UPI0028AB9331|nr:hypothetical protein [Lysinibacillus capsici]